jgi:hypothetical protein
MLVSAAILILDPNADVPEGGVGQERFSIAAERVAGAYSLVICGVAVLLTFAMHRKYSRRTWFSI